MIKTLHKANMIIGINRSRKKVNRVQELEKSIPMQFHFEVSMSKFDILI